PGFELRESHPLDGMPRAEEAIERRLIADEPKGDAARPAAHATRNQDDAVQEAPKLHGDVEAPIDLTMHHQREPRLEIPRQRGDDHVGPVADQVVERDSQGVHPVLQLLDDVLLIAPFILRSEEHTSELQYREKLVCLLLLEKKK